MADKSKKLADYLPKMADKIRTAFPQLRSIQKTDKSTRSLSFNYGLSQNCPNASAPKINI
ncbi:hypothetical protein ACIQ34_00970 [Ureibacillus sp. NPDC094379]